MHATDRFSSSLLRATLVLLGVLLARSACLAQAPAAPRKVLVADVLVFGNQRVSAQSILSNLKTRAGGEYDPAAIQDDVRALYATQQFGNVEVRYDWLPDGRVKVYFVVADYRSVIKKIEYRGAKHIKDDFLSNDVTGLKVGAALNPTQNRLACNKIVDRYKEKGRPFASCLLVKGGQPGDTEVIFSITEGPEVYVRDVEFQGNSFVSGGVLRNHIDTSEMFLGLALFSKPFNIFIADNDVKKLIDYYRSFGFQDVRVSRELRRDSDDRTVVLVFHVHEGIRYRVKDAPQVVGVAHFQPVELERLSEVRQGEYLNQGKVERDTSRIRDYIGYHGRRADVQERVVFTGPGECQVFYDVQERPPAKVGQIFVVGNTVTKQNVILRQLGVYPGQVLSYPELRVAEANLARLALFETNPETGVRPTVAVIDRDDGSDNPFKDILVTVQESRTGSLLFGLGFNSDAGATGSIVLNERNFDITRLPRNIDDLFSGNAFRGAGQELRIEAVPGTELQRYTISFREPFLFDSDYSLTVGGYYYTRFFEEYQETRLGSRVSVGRRLNRFWTASVTGRVENVGVQQVPFFAPFDYQSVRGDNFQAGVRGGLTYDDRDSYLRPTQGSLVDISYEQILGDRQFPLLNFDYNQYFTVYERADGSGRHVVALHSQVGYSSAAPVYERYFAGGFRSIRGFQFRGVGPQVNGFEVGGNFLFLNSVEYQIPVKANDSLYFVGFVDSGTVESDVDIKNYRVAAGVGVRFVVPMLGPVPIALDFGFPVVKGPGDREQIFSFWMGFFR